MNTVKGTSELPLKNLFSRYASEFTHAGRSTVKVGKLILPNKVALNKERGLQQITSTVSCWDSNSLSHLALNHTVYFITLTFFHLCERRCYAGGNELFAEVSSAQRPRGAPFRKPKRHWSEGAKSRLQGNRARLIFVSPNPSNSLFNYFNICTHRSYILAPLIQVPLTKFPPLNRRQP